MLANSYPLDARAPPCIMKARTCHFPHIAYESDTRRYQGDDGREDANATGLRVTRGGSFTYDDYNARCSTRVSFEASNQSTDIGLRVVIDDESILTDATKCSPP